MQGDGGFRAESSRLLPPSPWHALATWGSRQTTDVRRAALKAEGTARHGTHRRARKGESCPPTMGFRSAAPTNSLYRTSRVDMLMLTQHG